MKPRPTFQSSSFPRARPPRLLPVFQDSVPTCPGGCRPSLCTAPLTGRVTVTLRPRVQLGGAPSSLESRVPLTTLSPVSGTGTVFATRSTPVVCRGKPKNTRLRGPQGAVTGGWAPSRTACARDALWEPASARWSHPAPCPGGSRTRWPSPLQPARPVPRRKTTSACISGKSPPPVTCPSGLGRATTPESHQGVVLLEMGSVAAEDVGQGGLAHSWVSCGARGEEERRSPPPDAGLQTKHFSAVTGNGLDSRGNLH